MLFVDNFKKNDQVRLRYLPYTKLLLFLLSPPSFDFSSTFILPLIPSYFPGFVVVVAVVAVMLFSSFLTFRLTL